MCLNVLRSLFLGAQVCILTVKPHKSVIIHEFYLC